MSKCNLSLYSEDFHVMLYTSPQFRRTLHYLIWAYVPIFRLYIITLTECISVLLHCFFGTLCPPLSINLWTRTVNRNESCSRHTECLMSAINYPKQFEKYIKIKFCRKAYSFSFYFPSIWLFALNIRGVTHTNTSGCGTNCINQHLHSKNSVHTSWCLKLCLWGHSPRSHFND